MIESREPLVKLANSLYRCTRSYTNEAFAKYQLGSGTYPFLLTLSRNEGINQNQISKELNVDKAMSARAVKCLVNLGYIRREEDNEDSRAYKLFLTEKAKAVVPELRAELSRWNRIIANGLDEGEKEQILLLLGKVLENARNNRSRQEK